MEKRPDRDLEPRRRRHRHGGMDSNDFFGLEIDDLSPQSQVLVSLAVLIPVAAAVALILGLNAPFWIIFVFGWMVFPAFGLMVRGIAGISEAKTELSPDNGKERELLEALRARGELTSAQVAMETSLTVAEADKMLKELTEGGHLEVRVRGGGLFYGLWEPKEETVGKELRDGQ